MVTLHSIILKKEIYFRQIQEEFIYLRCLSLHSPSDQKKKKKIRKVTFLKPKFFGGSKREGMVPAKLSLRKKALKFQSLLISQACFYSSEALKMQGFLSFCVCVCVRANRESWSWAFLAEIMETGDKHCNVTDSLLHCRLRD